MVLIGCEILVHTANAWSQISLPVNVPSGSVHCFIWAKLSFYSLSIIIGRRATLHLFRLSWRENEARGEELWPGAWHTEELPSSDSPSPDSNLSPLLPLASQRNRSSIGQPMIKAEELDDI